MMQERSQLARQHLMLRLRAINRALRRLVKQQRNQAAALDRPDIAHLCITDQHVEQLLLGVESIRFTEAEMVGLIEVNAEELESEQSLRAVAKELGQTLPIDYLIDSFELQSFEIDALLTCASVEVDRAYERIIAFVHDDLNLKVPSVDLLCRLSSKRLLERRAALGAYGKLRSCRLLEPFGEITSGARTQLRLGKGVFEFLIGGSRSLIGARHVLRRPGSTNLDAQGDPQLNRIAAALRSGDIEIVGLWGQGDTNPSYVAAQIAAIADRSIIELGVSAVNEVAREFREKLHVAAVHDAILLIDVALLHDERCQDSLDIIADDLAHCTVPVLMTGAYPWRPTELLSQRSYVELKLTDSDTEGLQRTWSDELPELDSRRAVSLAARYRMSRDEISAVSKLARSSALIESNGKAASLSDQIEPACLAVASKKSGKYLANVPCRRGPDDLILPQDLHRQIMEIAGFSEAIPLVANKWGFGRMATGNLGIKCLFTGDPGTGKTLAAEVIANKMGMPLLKVNLAQIVSKWVGETEKNVDAAFQEATTSHAILFFDEADSLFGRRGEVKQGVDRYANLEVSHLLQRLEDHAGLVILASNLKTNIDSAFLRRFQSVLHFPRPVESERKRIWQIAFPDLAPLAPGVNPTQFAHLDMTGAGIVAAARTGALLASSEGRDQIDVSHIVRGIARQFRQEGRVLSPRELGEHANLLLGAT